MKKKIITAGFFVSVWAFALQAQSSVNSAGSSASGSGGSVSYSVGQVFIQTITSPAGSISEGVQHPFEFQATAIENIQDLQQAFIMYPNPVKQRVYLKRRTGIGSPASYRLLNLNGKVLETGVITPDILSVDMQSYAASVYFLEITQQNKKTQTFKIIKH